VSNEGGGVLTSIDCFCLTSFDIESITGGLVGMSGIGGGGLAATTTGSGGGGGGGGGGGIGEVSGGAPGGAIGKFAAAFFTSLFADFSAPDAFSTG
jgi:hypothetical protein